MYLAQHQLFEQVPALEADIAVPDYCCLGDAGVGEVNAWFGPAHTVSPLHFDPQHNFLAQVVGYKYVKLVPPEDSACVYPHPEGMLSNTSQVDAAAPDLARFPRFADARFLEGVLAPGEMLYLPPRYWHYVRALTVSFSVSFWWT